MKVELKSEKGLNKVELGDAIVFDDNEIRIIVRVGQGYGTLDPKFNKINYNTDSIERLVREYGSYTRVIKRNNLKLMEI